MVTINKGFVEYKNYKIPCMQIDKFIENNDDFLLNTSMKDLKDIYVFGIPPNFKQLLIKKVHLYDASSYVNSFIYNNKEYWLDKSQRASLFNLFNQADPDEEFEIVFGDVAIKEKASILKEFLKALERYAYTCFVQTQKHLNAINNIEDPKNLEEFTKYIEKCVAYDYTAGYPEKLELK